MVSDGGSRLEKNRNIYSGMLIWIYLIFLSYCILFKGSFTYLKTCMIAYKSGEILQEGMNLRLLSNISTALYHWKNTWLIMNLLVNVALFLPWGVFLGKKYQSGCKAAMAGALLSLCYELIQYSTGFGAFDVDDIVLNCAGTLAGSGLLVFYNHQSRTQMPKLLRYLLIQIAVNLAYVLCSTSFYYMFHMGKSVSKTVGLAAAIGIGCCIWYHRQYFQKAGKSCMETLPEKLPGIKTLCLWIIGKCLQMLAMEYVVANWMPDGWSGFFLTMLVWVAVLLLWYQFDNKMKRFAENK